MLCFLAWHQQAASVQPKFGLGKIVATPAALEAIKKKRADREKFFLDRHAQADWGEVDDGDKALNDQSLVSTSGLCLPTKRFLALGLGNQRGGSGLPTICYRASIERMLPHAVRRAEAHLLCRALSGAVASTGVEFICTDQVSESPFGKLMKNLPSWDSARVIVYAMPVLFFQGLPLVLRFVASSIVVSCSFDTPTRNRRGRSLSTLSSFVHHGQRAFC